MKFAIKTPPFLLFKAAELLNKKNKTKRDEVTYIKTSTNVSLIIIQLILKEFCAS